MKMPVRKFATRIDPGREQKAQATEPPFSAEGRRQRLLIRIGVLLPLLLLGFTLMRGASEKRDLPGYLVGIWQTEAPKYADCYMEITPARIVFGNAEQGYTLYFVSRFEQVFDRGETVTVVHYTDLDGRQYQMELVYTGRPRESIRFKNQPMIVWERRPAS
jgi:hypothetical protein